MKKSISVCVYGASSNQIDPSYLKEGYHLGEEIALRGWKLVFGAGNTGMMGAVVEGALKHQGICYGVSPRFFDAMGVLHQTLSELILTDTMRERKAVMEDMSDAFIMTPGGIGTFEEFFEILTLKQLSQLNKPICVLNLNGYYDPMISMLDSAQRERFMSKDVMDLFFVSSSTEEILNYIEEWKESHKRVNLMLDHPDHEDAKEGRDEREGKEMQDDPWHHQREEK